jgi:hypothetical protein
MNQVLPKWLLGAALIAPVLTGHAQSTDPLPPETVLVGASGTPVPTEETFTIAAPAQDLTVTLTDLAVPAAMNSATVVITQGGALIGDATIAPPATTAAVALPGAVGEYVLRVFGAPNAAYSVGTFTVCVAPKANPSNCIQSASLSGNVTAPATAKNSTVSTVSATLTVVTAGAYTVTFADDQFPVALQTAPNLAIFQGSEPIALGIASGTMVNLNQGVYTLLAIAQTNQTSQAGLYGINIAGPAGVAPLLSNTYPVGTGLSPALQPNNPSAQTLNLKITDFGFPASLATASAVVTSGATVLGTASSGVAGGTSAFAAPAGPLQVWSFATAGTSAGSFEVDLTSPSGSLLQTASAVISGTSLAYAFVTASLAAGGYQATASDFQFPAVLPSLEFAVAQNGVILKQAAMASTVSFNLTSAGPVVLLVGTTAPVSGNGLFDVNVQNTAAQLEFDKTQAVSTSGLFNTQTINIGTNGNFSVTLTDLKFPAQFQDLDLVVSSGGAVLGKIIGGGSFPIMAAPGSYQLSFIANPGNMQEYGMYALQIVNAPPQVTLTAAPNPVTVGATTTLTWTSTNATTCTGSGAGFTGSQSINSGSLAVAVSATTTFMLSCTGPGGMASQSVTVTANPAPSSSGGGGAIDPKILAIVAIFVLVRMRRSPRTTALS